MEMKSLHFVKNFAHKNFQLYGKNISDAKIMKLKLPLNINFIVGMTAYIILFLDIIFLSGHGNIDIVVIWY